MPSQNFELRNVIGKIYFPYFDGTSKCTVSSQIQKSDTYFHLNPMVERDSIKLDTLCNVPGFDPVCMMYIL